MQDDPLEPPPADPAATPPIAAASANLSASPVAPDAAEPTDESATHPAWADDLRKLYDAVVEEPLPDSLIDLLSQLDAED